MKHEIYEPREESFLLAEVVRQNAKGDVLDMGTGSGIQALSALKNPNVKSVLAADLNKDAVKYAKKQGVNAIHSDLFSNIKNSFDTIIFNPPYLPEDMREKKDKHSLAVCGGKHGWEVIDKFFKQASQHLNKDGIIILLFSSLTDQDKVDEIITNALFEFKEVKSQSYFFEKVLIYIIKKSELLKELEHNQLSNIHFLEKGKRGIVYEAIYKNKKAAVKVEKQITSIERIKNEITWLEKLNKHNIGPKIYAHNQFWFAMEFIEGEKIIEWLQNSSKKAIISALKDIYSQLRTLDTLNVNKKELTYPYKHIIVSKQNKPILIDFERAKYTEQPQNISQFTEFITSSKISGILESKGITINKNQAIELSKIYKLSQTEENFNKILKLLA